MNKITLLTRVCRSSHSFRDDHAVTGVEGSAELVEEANKEAVSDLFHLGLTSTVVLLL